MMENEIYIRLWWTLVSVYFHETHVLEHQCKRKQRQTGLVQ